MTDYTNCWNAEEKPKIWTRKQRLDNECTHREYFAQFTPKGWPSHVASIIGSERILKSKDPHFNDIPLKLWDAIPNPRGSGEAMRALDDYPTLASAVCISKEAARQYVESILEENAAND